MLRGPQRRCASSVDGRREDAGRRARAASEVRIALRRAAGAPWAAWPTRAGYGLEELGIPRHHGAHRRGRTSSCRPSTPTSTPPATSPGPTSSPTRRAHQAWYAAVNALFGRFRKFKADYSRDPLVHLHRPRGRAGRPERARRRRRRASPTRSPPTASTTSTAPSPTARRTASSRCSPCPARTASSASPSSASTRATCIAEFVVGHEARPRPRTRSSAPSTSTRRWPRPTSTPPAPGSAPMRRSAAGVGRPLPRLAARRGRAAEALTGVRAAQHRHPRPRRSRRRRRDARRAAAAARSAARGGRGRRRQPDDTRRPRAGRRRPRARRAARPGGADERRRRAATGDVLLFLHADTRLPAEADALVRRARSGARWPGAASTCASPAVPLLPVIAGMMNRRSR